jgi:hypothetical protein
MQWDLKEVPLLLSELAPGDTGCFHDGPGHVAWKVSHFVVSHKLHSVTCLAPRADLRIVLEIECPAGNDDVHRVILDHFA